MPPPTPETRLDNYSSPLVTFPEMNVTECAELDDDESYSDSYSNGTDSNETRLECNITTTPASTIIFGIPESISRAFPRSIVTLTPSSPFLANCLSRPDFVIPDASIPLTQFLYPQTAPLIRLG